MQKIIFSVLFSVFAVTLAACSVDTDLNTTTANQIARPAFMVERSIDAGSFSMQAWERMHERGQAATIYIEGDGVSMKRGAEDVITKIYQTTPLKIRWHYIWRLVIKVKILVTSPALASM